MTDQEAAIYLRDMLSRRLSAREIALCEIIADRLPLTDAEQQVFESLKTQFAAELAHATEAPASRETPDDEGGGLL